MKKIFLSFSVTGDPASRAYVRLLIARLSEQPELKVWIYESPAGRIASGASIADVCRARIDESDLFIALLTEQALSSDYVAMEVSHALWVDSQRGLSIHPLIATTTPVSDWPLSLQALAGFRGDVRPLALAHVDSVVLDVCLGLEIDYLPSQGSDPRLPLRHRVIRELQSHQSTGGQDIADFQRVLKRCDKAALLMASGDSAQALEVADRILGDFQDDYDGLQPYYLRIFRALCLLAEARGGRQSFESAHAAFDDIIRSAPAELDANAYAGRGHALLNLASYSEAALDYEVAERRLSRTDPALLYSQVRAQILADRPENRPRIEALKVALDDGLVCAQIGDSSRVAAVLVLACAHVGRVQQAAKAWQRVSDLAEVGPELVCEICHWLHARAPASQLAEGIGMALHIIEQRLRLEPGLVGADEVLLVRQRARILFAVEGAASALRQFDALLNRYAHHAPLYAEAAYFSVLCDQFQRAAQYCDQALSAQPQMCRTQCPVDAASWDAAIGQVYWLLGREAEARECHRRSGRGEDEWFAVRMQAQFGRARTPHAGFTALRRFFTFH